MLVRRVVCVFLLIVAVAVEVEVAVSASPHPSDRARPANARRRKPSNIFASTAAGVVKGAFKATGFGLNAAVGTFRPTHVDLSDIITSWRINQEVSIGKRRQTISCPATVEFRRNRQVLTRYEDEEFTSRFKFKQRKWPWHCTIEFEARAFQGPYDEKPVLKLYKGKFQRSLLNPSLITIKGIVYEPPTAKRRKAIRCGTFAATQRPALPEVSLVDAEGDVAHDEMVQPSDSNMFPEENFDEDDAYDSIRHQEHSDEDVDEDMDEDVDHIHDDESEQNDYSM